MVTIAQDLAGITAAPVLPMMAGGDIDWATLNGYARWVVDQGPRAVAVNMDAGEGHALDEGERARVLETYVAAAAGRCKVVAGIIAGSTREAVRLGLQARDMGADAIVAFPPVPLFLGQPLPVELVYSFHADLADQVGLPMVVFQFPLEIGPAYSSDILRQLLTIEQVIAIKDASFNTYKSVQIRETVHESGRPVAVLTGADHTLFEDLLGGSDGALIGFASTLIKELVDMHDHIRLGKIDAAMEMWSRIGPLARFAWRPPVRDYRPRMKAILKIQGIVPCDAVRAPLATVSTEEYAILEGLTKNV